MSFDSIISKGIKQVYADDFDSQKHYIEILLRETRGTVDLETIYRAEGFFVPNNEYMLHYFGNECKDPMLDIYDYRGVCVWDNNIVFPIRNVGNRVVGLLGYNPFRKLEKSEGLTTRNHYTYSSKSVFSRGKHLYMLPGVYEKAVADGYLVLTDGGFDMMSFAAHGINSASALGSDLTPETIFMLRFVKSIYLAEDNDSAGRRLYNQLKNTHPNVNYIRQAMFKDADDMIKSGLGEDYLNKVRQAISDNLGFVLRSKPQMNVF